MRGEWALLAGLCRQAEAVLLSSVEERAWFELALPGQLDPDTTGVLDGSLPKADWFVGSPSPRLSASDGQVHTVVLGRPLGLDPEFLSALAARGVHVHCHGLRDGPGLDGRWQAWLARARAAAPGHLHLHPSVDQRQWLEILSRYDAGWLHRFRSQNEGDLLRCTWDDLNQPARLGTLMAAGLPVLQQRSAGSKVAMDRLVERDRIGLLYADADDLSAQLTDRALLSGVRRSVWSARARFTFDHHTPTLIALFDRLAGGETGRRDNWS